MKLVWSARSLSDREDIFSFIVADSPGAAAAIDERIEQAAQRLLVYPESGRRGRVEGTRELVIGKTPYLIAYTASVDLIRILRILHGSRYWPGDITE